VSLMVKGAGNQSTADETAKRRSRVRVRSPVSAQTKTGTRERRRSAGVVNQTAEPSGENALPEVKEPPN